MAFIQMNIFSQKLMTNVPVNVILPVDKMVFPGMPKRENVPYKTLYLLHGVLGNYMDWVNQTRLIRYAEDNNLAVIMPSGDNAFYVEQSAGNNFYGEFVGQELVELTRKMFPRSCKREDTYIGACPWDFWDTYLRKALDWLPLEKSGMGISSGNIGI